MVALEEYTQAMSRKCKCGKFGIGGWFGYPLKGHPNYSRVTIPHAFGNGETLTELHTADACFEPKQIAGGYLIGEKNDNRKEVLP